MGREVRRVPKDWQHPADFKCGGFIPLHDGLTKDTADWDEANAKWQEGLRRDYANDGQWKPVEPSYREMTFAEWGGERPNPEDYMPDFPQDQRTHFQMYETCTEGTPISPVLESAEELARWLTDNRASFFGGNTTSYEHWLAIIQGRDPGLPVFRQIAV